MVALGAGRLPRCCGGAPARRGVQAVTASAMFYTGPIRLVFHTASLMTHARLLACTASALMTHASCLPRARDADGDSDAPRDGPQPRTSSRHQPAVCTHRQITHRPTMAPAAHLETLTNLTHDPATFRAAQSNHEALPLWFARFARMAFSRADPSNSVPKSLSMKTPTPKL